MEISESLRGPDRKQKAERVDIRKEAERMVRKHANYLKRLRDSAGTTEAFRETAMQATDQFKDQLQTFLKEHGAEDLYEELVGFVSGKVSEIVAQSRDQKN